MGSQIAMTTRQPSYLGGLSSFVLSMFELYCLISAVHLIGCVEIEICKLRRVRQRLGDLFMYLHKDFLADSCMSQHQCSSRPHRSNLSREILQTIHQHS
jgi:hypothetical protein